MLGCNPRPINPHHLSPVRPATSRAASPYTASPLLEPPKLGVRTGCCSVCCPRALPDEDVASRSLEALSRTPANHLLHLHVTGISPHMHTRAAGCRPLTAALLQNPASSLRLQRQWASPCDPLNLLSPFCVSPEPLASQNPTDLMRHDHILVWQSSCSSRAAGWRSLFCK
jgi:hypothetical protein